MFAFADLGLVQMVLKMCDIDVTNREMNSLLPSAVSTSQISPPPPPPSSPAIPVLPPASY